MLEKYDGEEFPNEDALINQLNIYMLLSDNFKSIN